LRFDDSEFSQNRFETLPNAEIPRLLYLLEDSCVVTWTASKAHDTRTNGITTCLKHKLHFGLQPYLHNNLTGCGNIFLLLKLSQNVYVTKTKYWQERVETHFAGSTFSKW